MLRLISVLPGQHLRSDKRVTGGFDRGEIEERLDDLGEQRLALMDEESVTLARRTNDLVAVTIAKYRTRFQGFATLPTAAPKEAAAELERAVTRLGLVLLE